jgi:beta-lactam-binding protein with PASTA domain
MQLKFKIHANTLKGLLIHLSIVASLFLLLSFSFFYKVLPSLTNNNKVLTVPDVRKMDLVSASQFLEERNLSYEISDSSFNSELPALTVLEQFPRPLALVKIYRKIHLTVNSRNPPSVMFPDLTGATFEFAQRELKNHDLKIGSISYRPDVALNAIIESKIKGNLVKAGQKISKGSSVDLTMGGDTNIASPMPELVAMQ